MFTKMIAFSDMENNIWRTPAYIMKSHNSSTNCDAGLLPATTSPVTPGLEPWLTLGLPGIRHTVCPTQKWPWRYRQDEPFLISQR